MNGETAVVQWRNGTQVTDMEMALDSSTKDAGWIMPTPRGTTISLGDKELLRRLAVAAAPEYRTRYVFRPTVEGLFSFLDDDRSGGAEAPGGVQVLGTTRVGPFDITTITGTDATQVDAWLTDHGYASRPELIPSFASYLDQGWVLQAVKLVRGEENRSFAGALPPLRMTWKTDAPVYPIRLSSHATIEQDVRLYLVSSTPLAIQAQAAPDQPLSLYYSGVVAADTIDPTLSADLHLTVYDGLLSPKNIRQDFTFRADPDQKPYRTVVWHEQNIFPDVFQAALVLLAIGAAVWGAVALVRRVRSGARPR